MEKLFVPYEIAKQLKEKGFDEPCFGYYTKSQNLTTVNINRERVKYPEDTEAPLYQQVIDWFLEEKGLIIEIPHNYKFDGRSIISWNISINSIYGLPKAEAVEYSSEKEEKYLALNKAIEEALKMI